MKKAVFAMVLLALAAVAGAQNLDSLLRVVGERDQSVRANYQRVMQMQPPALDSLLAASQRMDEVDAANQRIVFGMLDRQGWPDSLSEEANEAVWFVIQHASDEDQKRYMPLVRSEAEKGRIPWSDYAASLDRMLKHDGLPQRYGTQSHMKLLNGTLEIFCLWPVEDADRLDSLRAAVGLPPIAEYLKALEEYIGIPIEWDRTKTVSDMP